MAIDPQQFTDEKIANAVIEAQRLFYTRALALREELMAEQSEKISQLRNILSLQEDTLEQQREEIVGLKEKNEQLADLVVDDGPLVVQHPAVSAAEIDALIDATPAPTADETC